MNGQEIRNVAIVVGLAAVCASPALAGAFDPNTKDAQSIIAEVNARQLGDRAITRIAMTIKDGSGERARSIVMRNRNFDQGSKVLLRVEAPADVKNTAFLSIDYKDKDKQDEQWLYMPNLRRVTRVPSTGRSGPFMSSDFSYADLSRQNYVDYAFKLVEAAANVDGEDCWVIEAVPNSGEVQEQTGYAKTQLWISKSKLMPLQFKSWVVKGHMIKYIKVSGLRRVDDIWTPHRMQARTMSGQTVVSETTLDVQSVRYGSDEVTDDDFSQQRLAPGS